MNTFDSIIIGLGVAIASTLLIDHLTTNQNKGLATCRGSKAKQPISGPLVRRFTCARSGIGDKSAVEAEMQQCPLGPTCSLGGVCACTFCGVKPNGVQNTAVTQSGAIQSWGARVHSCGRSACYAAAVRQSTQCVTQVVATQGAAGTCGWGKCHDFSSCC